MHANISDFGLIPCETPLWAPEGHSQTILGDILPSPMLKHPGKTWIVNLPDGDQIANHIHEGHSNWVIILMHGLAGSAESKYIHRATEIFNREGHTVVRLNHRNCGIGYGLSKHPYHSGRSDDLSLTVKELRKLYPQKKILAIAYSMSANTLLLLMSRTFPTLQLFKSDDSVSKSQSEFDFDLPDCAITVNAPIDLEKSAFRLAEPSNRLYEFYFMMNLHFFVRGLEKQGQMKMEKGMHPFMKVTHFDHVFTAPRSGFDSGVHYYQTCKSLVHLDKIDRPTICLTSYNDPFISVADYLNANFSKMTRLHIENQGGHMGYLHREKTPIGTNRWLDYSVHHLANQLMAGQ